MRTDLIIQPKENIIPFPKTIRKELADIFHQHSVKSSGGKVHYLKNVFILFRNQEQLIFDENRELLPEVSTIDKVNQNESFFNSEQDLIVGYKYEKVTEKACTLKSRGAGVYYHWMVDLLPKFDLVKDQINSIQKFFINNPVLKFQQESLKIIGVNEQKIIPITNESLFFVKDLLVTDYTAIFQETLAIKFLRKNFLIEGTKLNSPKKRVLISRSKASRRKLINEDELFDRLLPLGFEKIFLEEYSLQQQATLFNNADFIVSPHGASLTNLIYCTYGTSVIELYSRHIMGAYWSISNLLGLNYWLISDHEINSKIDNKIPFMERNFADIELNVEEIVDVITNEINKREYQ